MQFRAPARQEGPRGPLLSLPASCLHGTAELQRNHGVYPGAAVDLWVGGVSRGAEERPQKRRGWADRFRGEDNSFGLRPY